MSRTLFTPEQQEILRQNVYVYRVSDTMLTLTKEFKAIFHSEYNKGILPREILQNHGFDVDILGDHRIWGIADRIRNEYSKYGEFRDPSVPFRRNPKPAPSEADVIKQLRDEVNYLTQEVEFLKKIALLRQIKK